MDEITPEVQEASQEAVKTATVHADAVETARQAQIDAAVSKTAQETKSAILESLKEIFTDADPENPEHMKIIYSKIPILCVRVDAIDRNIVTINENIKWAARAAIGAVITTGVGVIIVAAINLWK